MTRRRERLAYIKLDDLIIEPDIQRPLNDRWATWIADHWDRDAVGVLTVNPTQDDAYHIVDGQHRVAAAEMLRKRGHWNGQEFSCIVREGSRQRAAELFLDYNHTKQVRYIDKFFIRIEAREPVALAITDIIENHGFTISSRSKDGSIHAISACERVYLGFSTNPDHTDPATFDLVLDVVVAAWGRTTAAVNGQIIEGLGRVYHRYGRSHIDLDRMTTAMSRQSGGPSGLLGRAQGLHDAKTVTVGRAMADVIVDAYNRGLRRESKNRLPDWRG